MGVSKYLVGLLNLFTAALSIPIIGSGIWLASKHHTDCMRFLQWPIITIGVFILLVSLAGLVGSCRGITWLLCLYAVVMFLLLLLLFCFTVFTFVITYKGAGDTVSGKGFLEFHLANYSSWLQKYVNKGSVWSNIKSCLADSNTCPLLAEKYTAADVFYAVELDPIQSGCCKPPSACNYTFITATNWSNPSNVGADSDCQTWNNEASQLCYDCNSCKAGVLQNVKENWHKVGIINVIVLIFLIFVYAMSCRALRNQRKANKLYAQEMKYYGQEMKANKHYAHEMKANKHYGRV